MQHMKSSPFEQEIANLILKSPILFVVKECNLIASRELSYAQILKLKLPAAISDLQHGKKPWVFSLNSIFKLI